MSLAEQAKQPGRPHEMRRLEHAAFYAAYSLNELGSRLEDIWYAPEADGRLKQQVTRLLIEHVVADLDESRDEVVLFVKWSGGHHTELRGARRLHRRRQREDIASLLETLRKILDDASISRALNRAGVSTSCGKTWSRGRVQQSRLRHWIVSFEASQKDREGWLTQAEAATYLGISPMSRNRLIQQEIVPAEGQTSLPQVIRMDDLASPAIQAAVSRIQTHGNAPLPKTPDQKTLYF